MKARDTNKNMCIKEQLEIEGLQVKDLDMRNEFRRLRGDYGIKKTLLEQGLAEDLDNFKTQVLVKKTQLEQGASSVRHAKHALRLSIPADNTVYTKQYWQKQ